jgi:CRISPR-associated endonuclease/helicase Cas3
MSERAHEAVAAFDADFKALTGNPPFPWQAKLFHEWFAKGKVPPSCNLPTGLGKTSVMAIWLIALARGVCTLPRRLVYVVNRRTVVDQATREAEKLRENLRKPELVDVSDRLWELCAVKDSDPIASPLAISTLRGQFADNGEWRADPARPAIIVGTVDMIGSRLLFGGYRAGSWQLARHAGLIGQDALIVHDEAHLEPVFQGLIRWAETRQTRDGSPRPVQVMAMSATARDDDCGAALTLGDSDLLNPVVRQRFSEVKKALHLHPLDPKASALTKELVRLAWGHDGENVRVIVYVVGPKDAKTVCDGLIGHLPKAGKGEPAGSRVALLTGTVRGYEREQLLRAPAVHGLLHSHDPDGRRIAPTHTTWLVATSAGEVGADFDADHLVCDLAPMDAMIQRFGRVNRRGGEGRIARIDVVLNRPEKRKDKKGNEKELSPFDHALLAAARLLEKLPNMPSSSGETTPGPTPKIASPAALCRLVELHPKEYAAACSPQPTPITPHDVVLDAWALTSIQDDWPLAHDVHPYLHGLNDPEPEAYVAWRAELDELPSGVDTDPGAGEMVRTVMRAVLKHYPLRPPELLREKPQHIAELLVALGQHHPHRWVVRVRHRSVSAQRLGSLPTDVKQLQRELRYEAVIIPPSVGGLDDAGMIELPTPKAGMVPSAPDVADFAPSEDGKLFAAVRRRVLLSRDDEGQWRCRTLGVPPANGGSSGGEPPETYPTPTAAKEHVAKSLGMKYVDRVVLAEDDNGPSHMLLFYRKSDRQRTRTDEQRLPIDLHNESARQIAGRVTKALHLDPALQQAFDLAAGGHDLGKADPRWQAAIGNGDMANPLAKSFGAGFNTRMLNGYRHEFGSLRSIVSRLPDDAVSDLVLHLVASHHGRGRPHFELRAMADPAELPDELPPFLRPAETARRFARLQRRYGHWGLAWLESILMAADAESSAAPGAVTNDEAEEEET